MALTLNSEPPRYVAARNEVKYEFTTTDTSESNLRIQIQIVDDDGSFVEIFETTFEFTPDSDGKLWVDLKAPILAYMESAGIRSMNFSIRYRQVYDGSIIPYTAGTVKSAFYFLVPFAGNPDLESYIAEATTPGKFLQTFPYTYRSFKKQFDFIISDGLKTTSLEAVVEYLDINKQPLTGISNETVSISRSGGDVVEVVSFLIDTLNVDSETKYIRVSVVVPGGDTVISQMTLRFVEVCEGSLVFEYLNNQGGFEVVTFEPTMQIQDAVSQGNVAIRQDITKRYNENFTGKYRYNVTQFQKVKVYIDNLEPQAFYDLLDIKESRDVSLLTEVNGANNVACVLSNDYQTEYFSNEKKYDLFLEFEFANDFNPETQIDYDPGAGAGAFLKTSFDTGFD